MTEEPATSHAKPALDLRGCFVCVHTHTNINARVPEIKAVYVKCLFAKHMNRKIYHTMQICGHLLSAKA